MSPVLVLLKSIFSISKKLLSFCRVDQVYYVSYDVSSHPSSRAVRQASRRFRGVPRPDDTYVTSAASSGGACGLPVGRACQIYKGRHPGGILLRCPNHLNWTNQDIFKLAKLFKSIWFDPLAHP